MVRCCVWRLPGGAHSLSLQPQGQADVVVVVIPRLLRRRLSVGPERCGGDHTRRDAPTDAKQGQLRH